MGFAKPASFEANCYLRSRLRKALKRCTQFLNRMNELLIPSAALEDPNSFEILRVWAANKEQHVTIHSGLNGDAFDFGYLLAQLAIHGSKLYSERIGKTETQMLEDILEGFRREMIDKHGNPSGSIQK
jgi:hypothetical protein